MLVSFLAFTLYSTGHSQRTASVHEVQPSARDVVHAVWVNGPTHSDKLGGQWPAFGTGAGKTGSQCTAHDNDFTGYDTNSRYCEKASPDLDNKGAHLLLFSGRLAVVIDAGGISATPPNAPRNLFPKLGSTMSHPANASARDVYSSLASVNTSLQLRTTCTGGGDSTYILGTSQKKFMQVGLVRHGHAVTQLSLTALEWQSATTGVKMGPCGTFVAKKDPSNTNCNGHSNNPCPGEYPTCVGFVQGSSWGKCYSKCNDSGTPNFWAEVSMWGDSVNMEFAWDSGHTLPTGCTGAVTLSIDMGGGVIHTNTTTSIQAKGQVSLFMSLRESDSTIVNGQDAMEAANQVVVTTSTPGATVVPRDHVSGGPDRRDLFVEVPRSLPTCGYDSRCANLGISMVDIVATNPHPTRSRTLRLSFSRNFPKKVSIPTGSTRRTGAEITGLSAQLWDKTTSQATGIPVQISKNWHTGSKVAYWAGYDGYWWTVSALLRLPPNTTIPLSLAMNYERYGGVAAFSHAQLSIVGYSDTWLWEEAALGTGGENICFDPLGIHTRAFITDMRPKLFDGSWKENVGGGDMLLLFGANGDMQYLKELDPQIHSSGPCLSNASYGSLSRDGTMSSRVQVSGGRTDDLVRVFVHVRYEALQDLNFSRLVFFQLGSETYNYHATFQEFVVGNSSFKAHHNKTCTGGTSRAADKMYRGGPFRTKMGGSAPWWFSLGPNNDAKTLAKTKMVVGDRGLVIREFHAKLGGAVQNSPTFSVLCDKVEIGTPAGLSKLMKGDYLDMKLEILILPRAGEEYTYAKKNVKSNTLNNKLASLTTTWERVKAQAMGGRLRVIPIAGVRVESHYPIRVVATKAQPSPLIKFKVKGSALGFVPIVICGLTSHLIPSGHGLWLKSGNATSFSLLKQGSSGANDFWQTNYDRVSRTYEIVYNVEIFEDVTIAFGSIDATTQAHQIIQQAQGMAVNVSGQSGKFSAYRQAQGPSDPGKVVIEMDALREVDASGKQVGKAGSTKHSIENFASQSFTFSSPKTVKMGQGNNVSAVKMNFRSTVSTIGKVGVDTYIMTSGGIVGPEGEPWSVSAGDIKFNIELSDWTFCDAEICKDGVGNGVELDVKIKGKNTFAVRVTGEKQQFELGGGSKLQLTNKIMVDGKQVEMPAGYPKVRLVGTSQVFTFRFPKFTTSALYDPLLTRPEEGVIASHARGLSGSICSFAFVAFLSGFAACL